MIESARIGKELERQAARDLEHLPRQPELSITPVTTRRTQAEIEADFVRRSVVCCYCGLREVAVDNECSRCGVKRERKGVA